MNLFKDMTDQELKDLYGAYSDWHKSGFIKDDVLARIMKQYMDTYNGSAVILMEVDYLAECTKRFMFSRYISLPVNGRILSADIETVEDTNHNSIFLSITSANGEKKDLARVRYDDGNAVAVDVFDDGGLNEVCYTQTFSASADH